MSLDLPTPVSNYFKAVNVQDVDAMLSAFSDEASVHDEGQEMNGRAAIREWVDDTTPKIPRHAHADRRPSDRREDDRNGSGCRNLPRQSSRTALPLHDYRREDRQAGDHLMTTAEVGESAGEQ